MSLFQRLAKSYQFSNNTVQQVVFNSTFNFELFRFQLQTYKFGEIAQSAEPSIPIRMVGGSSPSLSNYFRSFVVETTQIL